MRACVSPSSGAAIDQRRDNTRDGERHETWGGGRRHGTRKEEKRESMEVGERHFAKKKNRETH